MIYNIFYTLFFIFSIFVLITNISYSIYEIKQQNNKVGGIYVICFSLLSIIFTNFILLKNNHP